jgi:hypothetical protein
MRIRELCQVHEHITVNEIVSDIVRAVEVDEAQVLGTLVELDRAGYIMIMEDEEPFDREVVLS